MGAGDDRTVSFPTAVEESCPSPFGTLPPLTVTIVQNQVT